MIVAPLHHSRTAVAVGLGPLLRLFLEFDGEIPLYGRGDLYRIAVLGGTLVRAI
jgi:hypothetical protein